MRLFRKCDGRRHKWSLWRTHNFWTSTSKDPKIRHRHCKCGAIQRFNPKTGNATIWSPDGLDSGLLDRGVTRKIFEDL